MKWMLALTRPELVLSSAFCQSFASWRSKTHRVGGASKPETQSDLLNASKDEVFKKVDQMYRDLDEYELETEEACPVFQNMALQAF
jgi:hypothetical protein